MATVVVSAASTAALAASLAARSRQKTESTIQAQPTADPAPKADHVCAIWLVMVMVVMLLVAIFKD